MHVKQRHTCAPGLCPTSQRSPVFRARRIHVGAGAAAAYMLTAATATAAAAPPVKQLDNGLTVILQPIPTAEKIALCVLFDVGEDHDPRGKSGLSHLTEHIYCCAAAGETAATDVMGYMQRYPDGWNAQTGTDYTVFSAVFPAERLESELVDAAARMGDLKPEGADLERERPRLLQEVSNMFGGIPPLAAANHVRERVRPSAEGHRKGGMPADVEKLTIDDVRGWWKQYYKPANATLVLAGRFNETVVMKIIEERFGKIPPGERRPAPAARPAAKTGSTETVSIKPIQPGAGAHACIGFAAPLPGDPEYPVLLVIARRLWMKSAPGGAGVTTGFTPLDDPTLVTISMPVGAGKTGAEAIAELEAILAEAIDAPLAPMEIQHVRQSIGVMLGLIEYPPMMYQHNLYGAAFGLGRRRQLGVNAAAINAALEKLTTDDVQKTARAIFDRQAQAAVIVQP